MKRDWSFRERGLQRTLKKVEGGLKGLLVRQKGARCRKWTMTIKFQSDMIHCIHHDSCVGLWGWANPP